MIRPVTFSGWYLSLFSPINNGMTDKKNCGIALAHSLEISNSR